MRGGFQCMKLLIKNGRVQQNKHDQIYFTKKNIVIEDNMITNIVDFDQPLEENFDKVIDAKDSIVIPGLVNAHLHSSDHFNKGGFDNLPLELWVPYLRPIFTGFDHSPDEIYLRTLLGAIEMIRTGTTAAIDDVVQFPALDDKNLDSIFKGYEKAGIRASITSHLLNKPLYKTIPYTEELLEEDLKTKLDVDFASEDEMASYMEDKLKKYNVDGAVQTYALAPSGPQRCSIELMTRIKQLAEKYNVPAVSHVLETKVQEVTAREFYGMSMIEYLEKNDLLYPNLNLVHTVWITDSDIERIKKYDAKVLHNPTSNLKLGSGVAPIKKLLDAGISVGIGTDNTSSNDSHNMFELMKVTGLIHKVQTPDYRKWVGAKDALKMSQIGGAQCALKDEEIGTIEVNKKADLVLLDTNNHRFIPENNIVNQLVFCENGSSVHTVIIDGEIVMEDKQIKTFDEVEVLEEVKGVMTKMFEERNVAKSQADKLFTTLEKAYFMSNEIQ